MSIQSAWEDVNWKLVQKRVSRQQRRVFKASMEVKREQQSKNSNESVIAKNRRIVHAIQRRIIGSLDARLLAVRSVTTENKGRNTPGLDRQVTISQKKKMKLASNLKLDGKASPIRRTYIPKPGTNEVRPFGIPTIEDRAKQMLAKIALEPEWEAAFEPNSYGFRPGRSCHDAIGSLFLSLRGNKTRFVLDADIQKCFDQIDHEKLLNRLSTFDQMKNQIKAWLKADIMVGYTNRPDEVFQSMEGTPKGRVISPLLANIALHGLETHIKEWYSKELYPKLDKSSKVAIRDRMSQIGFSRYADDFIITAQEESTILQIKKQVELWLSEEVGFPLSKIKTKIINSTEGFQFLGFRLISLKQEISGQYKLKIYPSEKSKKRLINRTRGIIHSNRSASSYALIHLLAPRIIGWANYFRYSQCSKDFSKLDSLIFQQTRAWAFRRKSKGLSSRTKIKEKYFPSGRTYIFRGKEYKNNWILVGQTKDSNGELKENFLPKLSWVGSSEHVKIQGIASPYDKNHIYWMKRMEKYSGYGTRISKLIKKQYGRCTICGQTFTPMDGIEADHIVPRAKGGLDKYSNLQALHKHCHIQKSSLESSVSIVDESDMIIK
jgi:RNA-directed DNA polymerase